jgi:hypothetical protein
MSLLVELHQTVNSVNDEYQAAECVYKFSDVSGYYIVLFTEVEIGCLGAPKWAICGGIHRSEGSDRFEE